jgi:hypothetical protein
MAAMKLPEHGARLEVERGDQVGGGRDANSREHAAQPGGGALANCGWLRSRRVGSLRKFVFEPVVAMSQLLQIYPRI